MHGERDAPTAMGVSRLSACRRGRTRCGQLWNTERDELYAHVLPGRVAPVTVVQTGGAHSVSQVRGIGAQPENAAVVLGETLVTSGSDKLGDHFFVADGFGQPAIRVDAPHLVPPAIMGDKVVMSGTLHHTPGGVDADGERGTAGGNGAGDAGE